MLTLVGSQREKIAAEKELQEYLKQVWREHETRTVAWRPDSRTMRIYHNGKFWFASGSPAPNDRIPRYWVPFGEYRENGNLQITVEINISVSSNDRRISGFFARDTQTGIVYLMHDGGVGGGRMGVGRLAFLSWATPKLVPVVDTEGNERQGIVVAPLMAKTIGDDIARFVQTALDFKQAAKRGETISVEASEAQRTYNDYYDEFSGTKRRQRVREIEYISRHGDIVRSLSDWRQRTIRPNEKITKNAYIDLGVRVHGDLTEIYEVKTNCERQTLYSAIGQLLVHEAPTGASRRFVVLPAGDSIPSDVNHAFNRADISLIRFKLAGEHVRIL